MATKNANYSDEDLVIEKLQLLEENSAIKSQQIQSLKGFIKILSMVTVVMAICLIVAIMAFRNQKTIPIGITPQGVVIPITPISENNVKPSTVANVAKDAFIDINWIGFVNTEGTIESKQQWFAGVDGAFDSWRNSIYRIGLIDRLKANTEVVSAAVVSAPVVAWSGPHPKLKNTFAWKVQFAAILTYAGAKGTATQNVKVEMLMRRVPENERIEGVAVEAIITT